MLYMAKKFFLSVFLLLPLASGSYKVYSTPENSLTFLSAPEEETGILLRYPGWSGAPDILVNGKRVRVDQGSRSYIRISRKWKEGDRITARFPMSLRLESTPDNPSKAAVLYGPVVLAGQMGRDGMEAPAPFSDPSKYNGMLCTGTCKASGIPVPSLGRTGAWIATAPAPPGTGGSSGRPPGSGQGGPDDCRRRRAGLSGYAR